MARTVTFQGNVLHLEGELPVKGAKAPDFSLLANDLSPRSLASYPGKALAILTVPSLDTPVCDMEVRRFNKEAASLSDRIRILAVSCDLPFAQARWCGAAGIGSVETLSDHYATNFGNGYGVLATELRLLARAVFVVDPAGTLTYVQLVPEMTNEPDYGAALAALKPLA